MTRDFFLWGALRHPALLAVVLGREAAGDPAWLDGMAVARDADGGALLVPSFGDRAEGVLLRDVSALEAERIAFYATTQGAGLERREIGFDGGTITAEVPLPPPAVSAGPWNLRDWAALWGPTMVATVADAMALMGQADPAAVHRRWPAMMVRGASRVRAAEAAPATLRRPSGKVETLARRQPYASFFSVEEYDLTFQSFGGGQSAPITRAAFVSGDAVTVLPYDPVRDTVLVIEQFRAGPFARGDANPWSLENIAGRIDPGETAEEAARREAEEEAGITFGELIPVANYYATPGAKTEFLYSFVAIADLPDSAATTGGLEEEGEDIRGHVIPFARLMELVATGEVNNAPLILTALWLARERPRLRA